MKIMAVDFGDARTGLAVCDKGELLASPLCVVFEKDFSRTLEKVAEQAMEQGIQRLVVGFPRNMNGSVGPRAQLCQEFAEKLADMTKIPTVLWDERNTTVSATQILNQTDTKGKKRKNVIDAVAATLILESYLNFLKNNPGAEPPSPSL